MSDETPAPKHHHHKSEWHIHLVLGTGLMFCLSALCAVLYSLPAPAPKPKPLPKAYEVILAELQEKVEPSIAELTKSLDTLKVTADELKTIAIAIKEDTAKTRIDVESLKKQGSKPIGANPQ